MKNEDIILFSNKSYHKELANLLSEKLDKKVHLITKKEDASYEKISKINPEYIFVLHWGHKIGNKIFEKFETIIFHLSDVPYGRGGSPIQNLILLGHTESKLSALKCIEKLDAGDVYLKKEVSLKGTVSEILSRAADLMTCMIVEIVQYKIVPAPQEGEVVFFKRRRPHEGDLSRLQDIRKIYDYIRMLDGEGYSNAFLETEMFKYEFYETGEIQNNEIIAKVKISYKGGEK